MSTFVRWSAPHVTAEMSDVCQVVHVGGGHKYLRFCIFSELSRK